MTNQQLVRTLTVQYSKNNPLFVLELSSNEHLQVYPNSINRLKDVFFFIAKSGIAKHLYIISINDENGISQKFQGEILTCDNLENATNVKQCMLNHQNAVLLREVFAFTRPILIGLQNSFGFGCRLGLANPGHLRAIVGTKIKPILAQQSIRELERTQRKPEEVLDAATWAVFQEGFKDGFGADADHLKTTEDIDLMVNAGFTMFTLDPGSYVVNEADSLPVEELLERVPSIPWPLLDDSYENFLSRYVDRLLSVTSDFTMQPDHEQVLRALIKYGGVIAHTVKLYRHLNDAYPDYPFELELSVDETESVTSPFEHFLVANELNRLGIKLVSLAPRFVGDFEKGIDYKGDVERFQNEYIKHVKISEKLGPYKISIHSGSDKFSVYQAIGALGQGLVHVKTAGTSYLEALRTITKKEPGLFREILDFTREQFESEKKSYHVSARIENVPSAEKCSDDLLLTLFEQNDARQVLHVTFGKVLTFKNERGNYVFRERLLECLRKHEDIYYADLQQHFHRHIAPFL
ncbi:MAG: tagaturonate epimerase family protein [bacterium]